MVNHSRRLGSHWIADACGYVLSTRADLLPACYDEWIVPERERLRQRHRRALVRLIELLEAQRDYEGAEAAYRYRGCSVSTMWTTASSNAQGECGSTVDDTLIET